MSDNKNKTLNERVAEMHIVMKWLRPIQSLFYANTFPKKDFSNETLVRAGSK